MKQHILLLIIAFSPIYCYPQEEVKPDISGNIEGIFDYSEQNSYSETQIEYLEFRKTNKLNLWNAEISDLTQFPNFDLITSKKIIDYVEKNPNTSIAKLSKELDLTGNQVVILEYCTYINEIVIPTVYKVYSRTKTNLSSDKIYGFEKGNYQGSKLDYSSRLFATVNQFDAGIIIDKDAGEIPSVDFISGHLKYQNDNLKIIIGDFYYELGMGNILWRDFPANKGSDVISPAMDFGNGLRPYRSTMDISNFRGGAAELTTKIGKGKVTFGLFGSSVKRSGTLDTLNNVITSLYTMGYYRTQTEINKRRNFTETAFLGNINYEIGNFLFGIAALSLNYQYPITSSSSGSFLGQSGILKTHFGRYLIPNFTLGYEISSDANNNMGCKIGSIYDLGNIELSAHFRYFGESNRSPYGSNFGEYSYPANEIGLYLGALYRGIKNVRFYNYIDFFKSIGRTYYIDGIVSGFAIFNQTEFHLANRLDYITRLKYDNKTDEININSSPETYQRQRIYWRNEFQYSITQNFQSRIRIENC